MPPIPTSQFSTKFESQMPESDDELHSIPTLSIFLIILFDTFTQDRINNPLYAYSIIQYLRIELLLVCLISINPQSDLSLE